MALLQSSQTWCIAKNKTVLEPVVHNMDSLSDEQFLYNIFEFTMKTIGRVLLIVDWTVNLSGAQLILHVTNYPVDKLCLSYSFWQQVQTQKICLIMT